MKKIAFYTLTFTLLMAYSCKNETSEIPEKEDVIPMTEVKVEKIETLFEEDSFDNPDAKNLLLELKICSDSAIKTEDGMSVPCSPKFFKFFKLREDKELKDAFMLLVKSNVGGVAVRRFLIFERENGQLLKVNGFTANLLERRKSDKKYDDLLLRFPDVVEDAKMKQKEYMRYDCLFSWDGTKYDFKYVESIKGDGWGGKVKLKDRDATSKEILETLKQNKMIF